MSKVMNLQTSTNGETRISRMYQLVGHL